MTARTWVKAAWKSALRMLQPGEPLDQRSLERISRAQSCPRRQHEVSKLEPRCHDARAQREPPARRLGCLQDIGGGHPHPLFAPPPNGAARDGGGPPRVRHEGRERAAPPSAAAHPRGEPLRKRGG